MGTSMHTTSSSSSADFTHRAPADAPRALPDRPAGEHYRPLEVRRGGDGLAGVLGWFSLGLGLSELLAPDAVARLIGITPTDRSRTTLRACGAREIVSGIGILSNKRRADWLWSRVAGDMMDLALLARAMGNDRSSRDRTGAAIAAVAGVAALDYISAQRVGAWRGSVFQNADSTDGRRPGAGGIDRFHPDLLDEAEAGSRRNNTARGVGTAGERTEDGVRYVTSIVTINRSVESVYDFWRNFENLPQFMGHLESVRDLGSGRSKWVAKAPAGMTVEWEAEITDDRPNELIAWRSLPGSDIANAGTVRFTSAPGGRGTEVRVDLEYAPPAGKAGVLVAKLFRQEPAQQTRDDLRRFKQVMELGEVVLSDASIHRGMHPAQPSHRVTETQS